MVAALHASRAIWFGGLVALAATTAVIAGCTPALPATPSTAPISTAPATSPPAASSRPVAAPSVSPAANASLSPAVSPAVPRPAASQVARSLRWTFDGETPGGPPSDADVFEGVWQIRAEDDAPSPPNALCQTGHATYPAIQLGQARFQDLVLSTRFKAVSGNLDQAAGVIFRVQDANNFYILRANALDGTLSFYKFGNGVRFILKRIDFDTSRGVWHELRVEVHGQTFSGTVDGLVLNQLTDSTFTGPGGIGLWTKSDSVTCFDDVEVSEL